MNKHTQSANNEGYFIARFSFPFYRKQSVHLLNISNLLNIARTNLSNVPYNFRILLHYNTECALKGKKTRKLITNEKDLARMNFQRNGILILGASICKCIRGFYLSRLYVFDENGFHGVRRKYLISVMEK